MPKKGFAVFKVIIIALSFLVLLSGCVPLMTTIYQKPKVEGYVRDISTDLPIVGVQIYHADSLAEVVETDEHGFFSLPSVSSVGGTVLMAGHALKEYKIILESDEKTLCVQVMGSYKMLYEEVVNVGVISFDKEYKEECIEVDFAGFKSN